MCTAGHVSAQLGFENELEYADSAKTCMQDALEPAALPDASLAPARAPAFASALVPESARIGSSQVPMREQGSVSDALEDAIATIANLPNVTQITTLKLGINHRKYFSSMEEGDGLLSAVLLLPASAAAGVIIVRMLRWGHQAVPTRGALEREAAYAGFLSEIPHSCSSRKMAIALVATVVWALAEATLIWGASNYKKEMHFEKALRIVTADTPVNIVSETPQGSNQTPCRRVQWKAGDPEDEDLDLLEDVEADLVIERCWSVVPLRPNETEALASASAPPTGDTVAIALQLDDLPDARMFVMRADNDTIVVNYETKVYFKVPEDAVQMPAAGDTDDHRLLWVGARCYSAK